MGGADDDTLATSLPTAASVAGELDGTGPPVGSAAGHGHAPTSDGGELIADRYRIVRWLGGGGMGRVYAVRDLELDEEVALKVLRAGLSDDAIERFRREVRLTRKIQHRNVARMFDIGEHAGDKFLTMELVDGAPLSLGIGLVAGARAEPMPWARLRPIAAQICAGLAAAHAIGVIHRDLKPDNVLIERGTERAVITDFGIARSDGDDAMTQVGAIIGTPRYMAPEQLAGREVDRRADLFSLGVMLFELATGYRPWAGDNAIAIAVAQAIEAPRTLVSADVPAAVAAMIASCLATDPSGRPASADDVAAAFRDDVPAAHRPRAVNARAATAPMQVAAELSSLAVLPVARAPGDDYLADGVHEDLTDTLSSTPTLRVRPIGAVRAMHDTDPRELGKQLAVDHVVDATLRRTSNGLRVTARLISVADGFQIWAHRIDCSEAEILAVSDSLARGIAAALSTRASAAGRPTDPRAVDLYLRARAGLRGFWGDRVVAAADLLEEAAAISPTSSAIIGALALASTQAWILRGASIGRARDAIARALGGGHAEALLASALFRLNTGELEAGAADLGSALARAPMSAPAHEMVGRLLSEFGDDEAEARRHFDTAIALDPGRAQIISGDLARLDALAGNWASSYAKIAALLADTDPAIVQYGATYDTRMCAWRGDREASIAAAKRFESRIAGPSLMLQVYLTQSKLTGSFDHGEWQRIVEDAIELDEPMRRRVFRAQLAAENAMLLGVPELGIRAIEVAVGHGLIDLPWLDRCPLLAPIADEPRVIAARAQVAALTGRMLRAFRVANAGT